MKQKRLYKKGDIVKVYSLQSFSGGGFINGGRGIVAQDQHGQSVIVSLIRKNGCNDEVDMHYEVYPQQLRLISDQWLNGSDIEIFEELIKKSKKLKK